ncbi:lipocalin-like domain-containing protein [Alistipes sp.]|uniref:lipocalin-like domain-containing protein n=1 Tax=Alistipes sp. TaxID=1872444 RepID=UPI003AB7990C
MKKLLALAFAACFAAQPLVAQSWADALQKALGGSRKESSGAAATPAAPPTAKALRGAWTYRAPAMDYTGDDVVAALAVGSLRDQLAPLYARAGLEPGTGTVRFADSRRVAFELSGHRMEGTYVYDARTGRIAVTLSRAERTATFEGVASMADGVLTLLFDARQALDAVGGTPDQAAQNEKLRQICAILEKYPGIRLGCKLSR